MFFEEVIYSNKDAIGSIVDIYNSNSNFLQYHLKLDNVNYEWVKDEIQASKQQGFQSFLIRDKNNLHPVGYIEYIKDETVYMTLFIIHKDYQKIGYGERIYNHFENQIKKEGCSRISIDVAIGYDESVLQFWKNRGFLCIKGVELSWNGRVFEAISMNKQIE